MASKRRRKLKVEDVQEAKDSKPLISFPEACIFVTTLALILGIAMILFKYNGNFGL